MNFGKYEYSASVKRTHLYSLRFFFESSLLHSPEKARERVLFSTKSLRIEFYLLKKRTFLEAFSQEF